jgi:O-antigen ligase
MTTHKLAPVAPPAPSPPRDWPTLLRRGLVVLVTALIVARPLVLGEDPGLFDPAADEGSMVLTFLWLVAAVGWAGWRLCYGQGAWYGGLVEVGLLVAAGCYFLSAGVAAEYRHPAWLVACEWLVLLVCLSLVRQLAGTAESRRGFFAAVLATGVCLAAYGIYQAAFELPYQHEVYRSRETLRKAWEQVTGRPMALDDPELENFAERVQQNNVFGTFANPNSFAGYLALLLPLAVGFAAVAWRRRDTTWQPVAAVVAAGLVAAALFFTHSRGANLAIILVGAVLALWFGRHFLRRRLAWSAGGVALLVVAGVVAARVPAAWTAVDRAGQSMGLRLNYWTAARGMIRDHPWLGVGPGNFSRYYPRYMVPTTVDEKITDPHNFVFDVWSNAGVFALAGLFLALGGGAWRLGRTARRPAVVPRDPPPGEDEVPWDFYLGGMVGLVLAFALKGSTASNSDFVVVWGAEAVGRSVVWFAAFALFWGIPWSGPSVLLALAAGMTACLLNLCVSGGIGFPSVAQPFWVLAALALTLATAELPGWVLRPGLPLFLPLPILAAAALVYVLLLLLPAIGCDYHLRQAQLRQNQFYQNRTAAQAAKTVRTATEHLQEAHKADPTNVQPLLELARWRLGSNTAPGTPQLEQALGDLDQARAVDPIGKEARRLTFELRRRLLVQVPEKERQRQLDAAEAAADAVRAVDPTESARLHANLAESCFQVNNWKTGYREALLAYQEDQDAEGRPAYRLTVPVRTEVRGLIRMTWGQQVGPVLACAPQGSLQVLPAFYLNSELAPPKPTPPPRR